MMMQSKTQSFLGARTMTTVAGVLPVPSPLATIPLPVRPLRGPVPASLCRVDEGADHVDSANRRLTSLLEVGASFNGVP